MAGKWDFSPRIEQKMNFVKFRLIKISFLFFERIEQNGTRFLLNSEKAEKSRADPRAPSSTSVSAHVLPLRRSL